MNPPARFEVLGTPFDAISPIDAITLITQEAANPTSSSRYVVKPYVEFIDRATKDARVRELLNGAWLSLADGIAAVWAAHYLYAGSPTKRRFIATLSQIIIAPHSLERPLPGRVAGITFTWPLLEAAAKKRLRVYLIGGRDGAGIARTQATLKRQLPRLHVIGTLPGRDPRRPAGSVSPEWIRETADRLDELAPDLILVGMGFPLQEEVMAQLVPLLPHGVFIGEGGTFDYEAFGGPHSKAPAILQRIGLEWLWRLILEPKRIVRQLAIPRVIIQVWRARHHSSQKH